VCKNNVLRVDYPGQKKIANLPLLHTNAAGDFSLMSREMWIDVRGYFESSDVTIGGKIDNLLLISAFAAGYRETRLSGDISIYKIVHDAMFTTSTQLNRGVDNSPIKRIHMSIYNFFEKYVLSMGIPWFLERRYMSFFRLLFGNFMPSYKKVPYLPNSYFINLFNNIVKGKVSYRMNSKDWGLGQESLKEFVINTADWEQDCGKN